MGVYENVLESARKRGIVPQLAVEHSRRHQCVHCGGALISYERNWKGRYLSEGEAKAWGRDPKDPVYYHIRCPEDEAGEE